jgi:hypothetical protein
MNRPDNLGADDHRPWPSRPRWRAVIAVAAAVLIGTSVLLPAGRHQWALSLFRQPARYTALAFRYAWLLPSVSTSRARIPLFFTISNQEGRPVRYQYVLRQVDPLGNEQTLSTASDVIPSGATWTVDTSVRPYCNLSPCRVEVVLPGYPEKINFLVVLKAQAHRAGRGHRGPRK